MEATTPSSAARLIEVLDTTVNQLRAHQPLSTEYLERIEAELRSFRQLVVGEQEGARRLKLGIVGQTKVGKSSLLNMLFFGGEAILPKASTPMTAALTRLSYGEQPTAEIIFYEAADWALIEAKAKEARLKREEDRQRAHDPDHRPCRLTEQEQGALEQVEKAPADTPALLGTTRRIGAASISEFCTVLTDYAGANGKYTPLTREIRLSVPVEGLRDFDIVDTPGLNDPIVSRSMITKQYLKQCDAVLLMSAAPNFLDRTDLNLIVRNLPNASVVRLRLVATKFDSALIQNGVQQKEASLSDAVRRVQRHLRSEVQNRLEALSKGGGNELVTEKERQAVANMKAALPVIPVSTIALQIAAHWGRLDDEEQTILDNLNRQVVPGFKFDAATIAELGNLEPIRQFFGQVGVEKAQIMEQKLARVTPSCAARCLDEAETARAILSENLRTIRGSDLDRLRAQQRALEQGAESAREGLEGAFEEIVSAIKDRAQEIKAALTQQRAGTTVNLREESRTEYYTKRVEQSGFWGGAKRFFGSICGRDDWGYEEVERSRTVRYLQVDSALEKIYQLGDQCNAQATQEIASLINRKDLARRLRGTLDAAMAPLLTAGTTEDADRAMARMAQSVNRLVNDLPFPEIKFESDQFVSIVSRKFSGDVGVESKDALISATRAALDAIVKHFEEQLDREVKKVVAALRKGSDGFVDSLKKDFAAETAKLLAAIADRENAIRQHEALLAALSPAIRDLQSIADQAPPPASEATATKEEQES